jgi:polyisoprenoid-binding protein YceI
MRTRDAERPHCGLSAGWWPSVRRAQGAQGAQPARKSLAPVGARSRLAAGLCLVSLGLSIGVSVSSAETESESQLRGSIEFVGRNLLGKAKGVFHSWRLVDVKIDRADLSRSFVVVEVDIASIDTGIGMRDKDLRGEDFFDVEKFPTATIRVHSVEREGEDGAPRYTASFDVRIRDIEKTLRGSFEIEEENPLEIEGSLTITRVDFGVGKPHSRWNPMSIREDVPIEFEVTLE